MSLRVDEQDEKFLKAAQKLNKDKIEFWKETRKLIFKGIKISLIITSVSILLLYGILAIKDCKNSIDKEIAKQAVETESAYEQCLIELSIDICYNMNTKCIKINNGWAKKHNYIDKSLILVNNNFEKCVKKIGINKCNLIKHKFQDNICF